MNPKCKCGGTIIYNTDIQLASYPPKYRGKCSSCNEYHTIFCSKYIPEPEMNSTKIITPQNMKYRLYSISNMYMHGIHTGIQAQHSTVELFTKYRSMQTQTQFEMICNWAENHKTTIVLNGGMHEHLMDLLSKLESSSLIFAPFFEPGINNACTNISIILSELEYNYFNENIITEMDADELINWYNLKSNYANINTDTTNLLVLELISKMNLAK